MSDLLVAMTVTAAYGTSAEGRLDLALSRLLRPESLSVQLHRLAERGNCDLGLAHQDLRTVTQLMALLDEPACGVANLLRPLA